MADLRRWKLTVWSLGLGTSLNPLNSSMLAVGLVALRHEFGVSVSEVVWIVTVFYLTSSVAQPLMGRVADIAGPRRVFVSGMALVSAASIVAPLSGNFLLLCAMRILISVGTSVAYPAALTIIRAREDRTGVSAIPDIANVQFSNSLGVVLGPVVGGLVVSLYSWKMLFWLSSPLALISLSMVLWLMGPDAPRGSRHSLLSTLDVVGVALFGTTMVSLLVALSGPEWRIGIPAAVLSIMSAVGLVLHSRRISNGFIDLNLLTSARTLPIYLGFCLTTMVYYCIFYGLPQYLEEAIGFEPAYVGLLMMPMAGTSLLANPFVAKALLRFSIRSVLLAGAVVMVFAVAAMLLLSAAPSSTFVLMACALVGVPYCMSTLGFAAAMYQMTPTHQLGVATGLLQSCRHLGGALAMSLIGLFFARGVDPTSMGRLVLAMIACCLVAAAVTTWWQTDPSD